LLATVVPRFEVLLAAAAFAAAVARRTSADRILIGLIPAVVLVTALMLNNAAPVYFIHVAPALLVPLGPLFSHGLSRRRFVAIGELGRLPLLAFAVAVSVLCAINAPRLLHARADAEDPGVRTVVERVRGVTDRRCKLAGDAGLYVRHFADYPYFISTRPTEVHYAMMFFGVSDEAAYWAVRKPDVVFGPEALSPGLAAYVSANGFSERAAGVWGSPAGCTGGP
jgi:hypothetical protein